MITNPILKGFNPDPSILRVPSWVSLEERRGFLRIKGMESMSSTHRQSMVARRQQAFSCVAETAVEFEPDHFQQMAGLILYYDTNDYVYLRISRDGQAGKCLNIVRSVDGRYDEMLDQDIVLEGTARVGLRAVIERQQVQFYYSSDEAQWYSVGVPLDITHLSDDFPEYIRFTGNFIGMCVQDLSGTRKHADFDYFSYREM